MGFSSANPLCLTRIISPAFSSSFRKRLTVISHRESSAASCLTGKYTNRILFSSDQGFAYSFLQIPSHGGHPCCSAIHFLVAQACSGLSPVRARPWRANQKKTRNLFLISCFNMPLCMYGCYSIFNWLQFYKREVIFGSMNASIYKYDSKFHPKTDRLL